MFYLLDRLQQNQVLPRKSCPAEIYDFYLKRGGTHTPSATNTLPYATVLHTQVQITADSLDSGFLFLHTLRARACVCGCRRRVFMALSGFHQFQSFP